MACAFDGRGRRKVRTVNVSTTVFVTGADSPGLLGAVYKGRQLSQNGHDQIVGRHDMITFSLAKSKQVLWVEFGLPISEENYLRLDAERAVILRREGPMDLIMDFTTSPTLEFPTELARQRAFVVSPVPSRRRIYVAPSELVYGMFRMWSVHHDDPNVHIVRSRKDALAALSVEEGDFVRLAAEPATGGIGSPHLSRS